MFQSVHTWGVPISHNALQHFPECHGTAGGVPARSSWGVPCQVQLGGTLAGEVSCQGGTLLGGTLSGGTLPVGTQVGYPPRSGGGYPVRTTEGVFTTRRAVCLLCSRRRTFLFNLITGISP